MTEIHRVDVLDPIGSVVPGWRAHTTAPSSPVLHSARSSPSLQLGTSRRGQLPTFAGIGPIPTETAGTGTIVLRRPTHDTYAPPSRVALLFSRE